MMTSKGASDAACISKMDFNILHVWKGRWPGCQESRGGRQAGEEQEEGRAACSLLPPGIHSGGYCSCCWCILVVAAVFYSRFLDVTLILLAMTMNIDVACGPLCMWPALAIKCLEQRAMRILQHILLWQLLWRWSTLALLRLPLCGLCYSICCCHCCGC